jgi:hypothetical protein
MTKSKPKPQSHSWRASGLSRRQRVVVDEHAALVAESFRRRFYVCFSDHLARALLARGGEVSLTMVRTAAELASLSLPKAPTTGLLTPPGPPQSDAGADAREPPEASHA